MADKIAVRMKEAAAMLSVSVRTLQDLTARGEVPCIRVGKKGSKKPAVLYNVATLQKWLAKREK
jgi:excisionase family DNA binding protein